MISLPLFKKNMLIILKLLVIFLVVLFLYDIVIVYMFDPTLADMINQFQDTMPELMSLFGMSGESSSLIGFLNTYLYGMLLMVFPIIFSIIATNSLITSYVDRGSMACLLATPNSRKKIILTQLISLIFGMFLLMTVNMLLIIASAEILFPGELIIGKFVLLNLSMLLVQLVILGISYFSACLFNDSKGYYILGGGLPILFYVIQMAANMGEKLTFCKYFTIFTLYRDVDIINGSGYLISFLVLILLSAALYTAGTFIFTKKNLFL